MSDDFITSITLGDQTFQVAQITLGQAPAAWAAFDTYLAGTGSGAEKVQAFKSVLFQVCRAANPSFKAETLDSVRGVKPTDLYSPQLSVDVGRLLGYDMVLKEKAPGEGEAGGTPAA
jgi:hypothetical protein